jgi:hypothetical protein
MLQSSDVEPERLRRLLADQITQDQAREFRRYFLTRLALIIAAVWVLSWPIPLLPHTVLWSLLAAAALAIGLMSPPSRSTTPDKTPPRQR